MSTMEIVLLVLGIIAFVLSFLISDKSEETSDEKISKEKIKELVEEEYGNTKEHLQSTVDETVNYSIEKAERSLERITNEKILALGEYSDSIMNQINTNHQETVFMYDMLTSSKEELVGLLNEAKRDSGEANSNATQALAMSLKAIEQAEAAGRTSESAQNKAVIAEEKMIAARRAIQSSDPQPYEEDAAEYEEYEETEGSEEYLDEEIDAEIEDYAEEPVEGYAEESVEGYVEESVDSSAEGAGMRGGAGNRAADPSFESAEHMENTGAGGKEVSAGKDSRQKKAEGAGAAVDHAGRKDGSEEEQTADVQASEPGVETIQMALQKATKEKRPGRQKKTGESIKDKLDENASTSRSHKSGSTKKNNNDQILKLHKQGLPDVTIARQLGLGVGEVKLVIDLYEKR